MTCHQIYRSLAERIDRLSLYKGYVITSWEAVMSLQRIHAGETFSCTKVLKEAHLLELSFKADLVLGLVLGS